MRTGTPKTLQPNSVAAGLDVRGQALYHTPLDLHARLHTPLDLHARLAPHPHT